MDWYISLQYCYAIEVGRKCLKNKEYKKGGEGLEFQENEIEKEDILQCKPIIAYIRLSGYCNASCPFCFVRKRDDTDSMPVLDVKDIILQLKKLGTKEIVFTGGECTINSNFSELLHFVNENRMRPSFITNGSYLSENAEVIVRENVKRVIISWDFASEEQHDKMRKINGLSKKIKSGIRRLAEENEVQGKSTKLHSNMVVHKNNMFDFKDFLKITEYRMLDQINLIPIKGAVHLQPTYEDMVKFNSQIGEIEELYQNAGIKISNINIYGKTEQELLSSSHRRYTRECYKLLECYVSHIMIFIDNNGDVYPCNSCDFKKDGVYYMGNYYESNNNLFDIWNSDKIKQVRSVINQNKKTICSNCDSLLVMSNRMLMNDMSEEEG